MKHYYEVDDKYVISNSKMNNLQLINDRINMVSNSDRGKLKSALSYLYLDEGPINLPPATYRIIEKYLDEGELVLAKWLKTRTNGSLRSKYGSKALVQARKAKYKCEICGYSDVRALNIDHIDGRVENTGFQCICANCHSIKSRIKDWDGNKRY